MPVKWNSTRVENRLLMKICAVAANAVPKNAEVMLSLIRIKKPLLIMINAKAVAVVLEPAVLTQSTIRMTALTSFWTARWRGGTTGNVWGDAVFAATQAANMPVFLGSLLDEVVVDVPDKLITLIVVFFILKGLPNKLTTLYEANSEIETLD